MGEVLHRIEEARDALVCFLSLFDVNWFSLKKSFQNASSETYLKKLDEFRKTTIGKAKVNHFDDRTRVTINEFCC